MGDLAVDVGKLVTLDP